KLVGRESGGVLGAVAVRDRVFVSDDDARSFLDGFRDSFPVVWYECSEVDDLDRDALLFQSLRGLVRPFYKCAIGNDRNVVSFTDSLCFAERDQKLARRVLRFVVDLTVEMLVFQEYNWVVAA